MDELNGSGSLVVKWLLGLFAAMLVGIGGFFVGNSREAVRIATRQSQELYEIRQRLDRISLRFDESAVLMEKMLKREQVEWEQQRAEIFKRIQGVETKIDRLTKDRT